MLAEHLWRPNSGCEHSEEVGGAIQQQQQWVTSTGTDISECDMQAPVHCWQKCRANGCDYVKKPFCSSEFALPMIVCSLYLLECPWKLKGGIIFGATYIHTQRYKTASPKEYSKIRMCASSHKPVKRRDLEAVKPSLGNWKGFCLPLRLLKEVSMFYLSVVSGVESSLKCIEALPQNKQLNP